MFFYVLDKWSPAWLTECNPAGCCFKPITNKDNAVKSGLANFRALRIRYFLRLLQMFCLRAAVNNDFGLFCLQRPFAHELALIFNVTPFACKHRLFWDLVSNASVVLSPCLTATEKTRTHKINSHKTPFACEIISKTNACDIFPGCLLAEQRPLPWLTEAPALVVRTRKTNVPIGKQSEERGGGEIDFLAAFSDPLSFNLSFTFLIQPPKHTHTCFLMGH